LRSVRVSYVEGSKGNKKKGWLRGVDLNPT
jgi:hypothetical protein